MTTKSKAGQIIGSLKQELAELDDRIIGEVVGVMQAISELRKALDDVEGKLFALRRDQPNGRWSRKEIPLAANATVHIAGTIGKRDTILASAETMLSQL